MRLLTTQGLVALADERDAPRVSIFLPPKDRAAPSRARSGCGTCSGRPSTG
jgi:hypothetical protein